MSFEKYSSFVNERRHLLQQLSAFNGLMEEAVNKGDQELYEKCERDFNHLLRRLEFVGKRS